MEIQSINLPTNFPSEIRGYDLHINQENLSGNACSYLSLKIKTKDGNNYKSESYEMANETSLADHLEIIKRKVLYDISNQISEKLLSSKSTNDSIIDISSETNKTEKLSKKSKSYKKSKNK